MVGQATSQLSLPSLGPAERLYFHNVPPATHQTRPLLILPTFLRKTHQQHLNHTLLLPALYTLRFLPLLADEEHLFNFTSLH